MGLPLAPSLAYAFMYHHEEIWLRDCPLEFKPLFYRRYVDDTFVLFNSDTHANKFLNYLNGKHPNIEFTLESELNNSISFLDIVITKVGNSFTSSVFRKKTYTGLGLNFFSYTSKLFKVNAVKTLIERAFKICSSYLMFHAEMEYLRQYFINNKYPVTLVDYILRTFLDKRFMKKDEFCTVGKMITHIKLPYYGKHSFKLPKAILQVLRDNFSFMDFCLIFVNSFRIKSLFS